MICSCRCDLPSCYGEPSDQHEAYSGEPREASLSVVEAERGPVPCAAEEERGPDQPFVGAERVHARLSAAQEVEALALAEFPQAA